MIELRHLRYFRTVAETLHFGRAAELLHISQLPLTRQIAALEKELGVPLFDRSKRSVQLTEAGKHFYRDTAEIFHALERAKRNAVSTGAGHSGSLLVGFMMSSAYNILPSVTRHYSAAYPEVDMRLTEHVPNLLAVDIREGKRDVGMMYRPEDCSGLDSRTIFSEPLVAVLPRSHALASREKISAGDLANDPFVSIPRAIAPPVYDLIVNYCRQAQAQVIVRGLRVFSDFEHEFRMALANHRLAPDIDVIALITSEEHSFLSGSTVREIASLNGDVTSLVPPHVGQALQRRLRELGDDGPGMIPMTSFRD